MRLVILAITEHFSTPEQEFEICAAVGKVTVHLWCLWPYDVIHTSQFWEYPTCEDLLFWFF